MEPQTEIPPTAVVEELVRRAKGIIAGTVPTQPMGPAPEVEWFISQFSSGTRPRQEVVDWHYLAYYYAGKSTACFQTLPSPQYPQGHLVVLASEDNIRPVLSQLTNAERRQIVIRFPPAEAYFEPVPASQRREDPDMNCEGEGREPTRTAASTDPYGSPRSRIDETNI